MVFDQLKDGVENVVVTFIFMSKTNQKVNKDSFKEIMGALSQKENFVRNASGMRSAETFEINYFLLQIL